MKTRQSIVAMVKAWIPFDEDGYRALDEALRERVRRDREAPTAKLEWHLAWTLGTLRRAARALTAAGNNARRDVEEASEKLRNGQRVSLRDYLETPETVGSIKAARAQIALAQEALDQFLDVYQALAVDGPTSRVQIVVTRRSADYHAAIAGTNGAKWGAGATAYEAIGDVVAHHSASGIDIVYPGPEQ